MYTNFEIHSNFNHKKAHTFADFEQVIIKIGHFADFEQERNSWEKPDT